MSDKKNYLVTGAAGFIASRVAALLVQEGHRVVGVDNLNDYYDVSLKQHRRDQLIKLAENAEGEFEFHQIDIEDRAAVGEVFEKSEKFDAVFNLAARAGVRYSMENPHVYMTTNAMGSLNLLEEIRERGIEKYVLASTSSLYAGQDMPFTETLSVNTPISPYAASKKAAEVMAYTYHYLYGIDVSVCRYFTVYGPAGRPDMCIFRFIYWIEQGQTIELFGDGEQSRDFTFVDDIARGTIAAQRKVGFEVINLGGGKQPVSLNTVLQQLSELLGKPCKIDYKPFHKADIVSTWADISKAEKLLGWMPQTSLSDGLAECVNWYMENRPWSQQIKLP